MNADEATVVLRVRRDLTGESFNDGTIEAWAEALGAWPMPAVRAALIAAARQHQRVSVAHVAERLPQRATPPPAPPVRCELCEGSGLVSSPRSRAHNPKVCRWPADDVECYCHAAEPCRCTAGDSMRPVLARLIEHNDRTRPRHLTEPLEPRRLDPTAEQERLEL